MCDMGEPTRLVRAHGKAKRLSSSNGGLLATTLLDWSLISSRIRVANASIASGFVTR
jgi:hypothetical protein